MKLRIIALAAALAGCSVVPAQAPIHTSLRPATGRGSWMTPATSSKNLLYLSAYDAVDVYDYATSTEVGSLTGFDHASGSCTDAKGDVFITNTGDADVLEFAHGGTKPTYVIDPYPYPVDCSIDPSTGNLAVVNEYGASEYSPGNIAVYAQAKGTPKVYKSSTQLLSATYDAKGDLLVSGSESNNVNYAVLVAGGSKLQTVSLQQFSGTYASWVRWDGEYFVVEVEGQDFTPLFVMFTLKGTSATEEGFMAVNKTAEGEGPFWLGRINAPKGRRRANQLVASPDDSGVMFWDYPEGGLYVFRFGSEDQYGGVTVSSKGG